MRHAARCHFVALLLVLTALSFTAPGGATGPAECGVFLLPCETGPGEWHGMLQPYVNEHDYYMFTPPDSPAVVRITATANIEINAFLYDPEGKLRAWGTNGYDGVIRLAAVAQPAGEWRLEIGYGWMNGALLGNKYSYSFSYDMYDHVARQSAPGGHARSLTATLAGGADSRVELVYGYAEWSPVFASYAYLEQFFLRTPDMGYAAGGIGSGCCGFLGGDVKTWGTLPEEIHVQLPTKVPVEGSLGTLGFDNHGRPLRFAYSLALSFPLAEVDIWSVWNGETPPTIEQPQGDSAFFYTLDDFEGDTPGLLVGPLAYVEDVSVTAAVPSAETHASLLFVNGYSPGYALHAAEITLHLPDGTSRDMSGQADAYFWPESQEGDWRLHVHRLDGYESDRIFFAGAHFAVPFSWLFKPLE